MVSRGSGGKTELRIFKSFTKSVPGKILCMIKKNVKNFK
jgi:hypothetical protein